MSNEDPFYQRAEFLVARGYVPASTDVGRLAENMRKTEANKDANKKPKDHVNTRESVFGNAEEVEERMRDKAPVEKRLLRPYESVASKKDLDKI